MTNRFSMDRRVALGAFAATAASGLAPAYAADAQKGSRAKSKMMKAWQVGERQGADSLVLTERPIPSPGPGQVLLKVLTTGINAVDLGAQRGIVFGRSNPALIPLQDNCSEVVALGPGVTTLKVGDRVTTTLYIEWTSGPWDVAYTRSNIGLGIDGFLAEYAVMPAATLALVPPRLSNEEAATLAIAGLTAWRALAIEARVKPGETVVTTGTGGVSTFCVQVAKMLGARVIVTSSSDEKLQRMKQLGADIGINYKTSKWQEDVLRHTGGAGAEVIINNVGWPEIENSLIACAASARIIHVGAGGSQVKMKPWPNLIMKNPWIKGFTMAGREMLGDFLSALEFSTLTPVVDKVFSFDQAPDAYLFMEKSDHIGKVVIRVS